MSILPFVSAVITPTLSSVSFVSATIIPTTTAPCPPVSAPPEPASPASFSPAPAPPHPAKQLDPQQRRKLALEILAGRCLSELADEYHVSRKFLHHLKQIALRALDDAFAPELPADKKVLFHLPVTRAWLEQLALALVLTCHSSLRGVHEVFRDLFDVKCSVGTLHSLVYRAIGKAALLNAKQDLHGVLFVALDEIFQGKAPILSVVDLASSYCCLLSLEEHRDGDTWGVRLLELLDQGLSPLAALGDLGTALRAGLNLAQPDVPFRADHFHVVRDAAQIVRFLENRAYTAISTYDKLCRHVADKPDDADLQRKREAARLEMLRAIALADDVATLVVWLRQDVLAVAGPCWQQRQALYDFVLAQMQARQPLCEHRLKPLCGVLRRHQAELLAFAQQLDGDIQLVARHARASEEVVRAMLAMQELPVTSWRRWRSDAVLHQQLGERYHEVSPLVEALREGVFRASSVVENVNSRLRNYLFLRKEVGQGYLELLRFYLNHHRFLRSEHPERAGKSPAELLSGQKHGHWLEMLGYQLFRRAA
jgi:hypothetical protein